MSLALQVYDTPRHFLNRAEPWLLRSEAEHSLVLGIAGWLATTGEAPGPAPFFATIEQDGEVVGAAFRTPPHKLSLSRMPLAAVPLVAESAERFGSLPAVLGPPAVAEAFAEEWAHRHGVTPRAGMRQRIFELTRLVPPDRLPEGSARWAEAADLDTVTAWIDAFEDEAATTRSDPREWAERHVRAGEVLLWEHDGPVAMAADVARSPNGARVGAVYTPPTLRGRGYATAVVAELSRRLLDGGLRLCSLYTDLANPTSNGIYRRLGYAPVADVVDVVFGPSPG